MKLISLNVWGGRQLPDFVSFINTHKDRTDVFCFQEVYANKDGVETVHSLEANLFGKLSAALSDFNAYFVPTIKNFKDFGPVDFNLMYGLAVFIRKDYTVQHYEEIRVYSGGQPVLDGLRTHPRDIQVLDIVKQEKKYRIINVHGLWNGGPKDDNPERLVQTKHIINVVETSPHPVIVTGDFNLKPNTKSIQMLEECGLINLITEYGIISTRSDLYTKEDRFADYLFISPKIKVRGFSVPNMTISDHRPLIFEAK